jgi:pimeloyl-ACP methyl ester carboxylesterase
MREAHSFAWHGYAVGSDPEHGKMNTGDHPGNMAMTNTIYQNAQQLAMQVKYAREVNNAWHVDLVGHSMGGLISRQYINTLMPPVFDGKPEVTHLVMLGTPNMGSPCADTATTLAEDNNFHNMQALRELKPVIVRAFNTRVNDRKGVKFSVMIGVPLGFTCLSKPRPGDGVVPWESARYNIADHEFNKRIHIEMTGKEDFDWFVKPRLAIGPKKAQSEQTTAWLENSIENNFALAGNDSEVYQKSYDANGQAQYFHTASYNTHEGEEEKVNLTVNTKVELQPHESREIDVPVNEGNYAGLLLLAGPGVSATLMDASGAIVGENKAGADTYRDMFRTINVTKPISKGVWKLKLENLGDAAATAIVGVTSGAGSASGFTVEAGKATAAGIVPFTAKWTENSGPILNAMITATIVGASNEIVFFDDGRHGDGAANDGTYGASTGKLGPGNYSLEAKAEANNLTREAAAAFSIGAAGNGGAAAKPAADSGAKTPAKLPAKPAARPSRKK